MRCVNTPAGNRAAQASAVRAHVRLVQQENLPLCRALNVARLARAVAVRQAQATASLG
jgi:hypothetical protein